MDRGLRAAAALGVAVVALGGAGCAGSRTYPNGIKHCYLCAVKVARQNGYEIREQDFHEVSGDLLAARSTPDPKETPVSRGFFRRFKEVFWNLWENGKFELWDEDIAASRVRIEERLATSFSTRRSGPLGWLGVTRKNETRIKVALDLTDYGREDWVIRRAPLTPAVHERMYKQIADCLGYASPTAYLTAAKIARTVPPPAAPEQPAMVVAAAPSATTVSVSEAPVAVAEPGVSASVETPRATASVAPLSADAAAALLVKARTAYEAGKYDEAIPALERIVASDPDSAEAFGYLGAAYYQRRRLDDAIRAYTEYVRLVPSDLRTQSFIDEIRKEQSQPK